MSDFLQRNTEQPVKPLPPVFETEDETPSSFLREAGEFLWETVKVIIISLAIILPIRFYVIQPFYVKGSSMEPNFFDKEYLIINEIGYRLHAPQRGEVTVFHFPDNPSQSFIKRIIGLPGERVIISDGQIRIVQVSGEELLLNESAYLDDSVKTSGEVDIMLSDKEFFVLGDNRPASYDSRAFGPVDRRFIIGRAMFRGWPIHRIAVIHTPFYSHL